MFRSEEGQGIVSVFVFLLHNLSFLSACKYPPLLKCSIDNLIINIIFIIRYTGPTVVDAIIKVSG